MLEPSAEGLGLAIAELRERQSPAMSQTQLAKFADYKGGAVSISRIETGVVRPQNARLAGIARALGVTPEQLLDEGIRRSEQLAQDRAEPVSSLREQVASTRARHARVTEKVHERTKLTQETAESFNTVHNSVRDKFFMQFVEIGATIEEAEVPKGPAEGEVESTKRDEAAQVRIEAMSAGIGSAIKGGAAGAATGAAGGAAAAYATFTAASMFGTASTGAAISGLSGVAATNATLAMLGGGTLAAGGAGIAGGTLLLTSMIAAPATILAVAGFMVLKRQRTKKQEARLRATLDEAEHALDEQQRAYDTMIRVLEDATAILDYASVHATHALARWVNRLPPEPRRWSDLGPTDQARYLDFLTVAACVMSISSINVAALLTATPAALDELDDATTATLAEAGKKIQALV